MYDDAQLQQFEQELMQHELSKQYDRPNNRTFVIFFHGFGSDEETTKYTCITHQLKSCVTVDFAQDFARAFEQYDQIINEKLNQYDQIVLAGHSLGGYFAHYFASKYELPALLIAPCLKPAHYLSDRIKNIADMNLSIEPVYLKQDYLDGQPSAHHNKIIMLIENDDEVLAAADAKPFIEELAYDIRFFNEGHHRICRADEINMALHELM